MERPPRLCENESVASRWLLLLPLLGAGCRFDLDAVARPSLDQRSLLVIDGRSGERTHDSARAPDAATDLRRDVARPDVRPPDQRPPDKPPPDKPPPDKPPPDKPPAKTCWDLYHLALSYELCEEKPKSCRFYVWTAGASCNVTCLFFGGICLGAQNNGNSKCSPERGSISCSTGYSDQICECSKP
jgi:hypothetical protein